jgi:putative transcriptional regulator
MNRIKEVLQEQGRSQRWLSKYVRRSYIAINKYANNVSQPHISILFQISYVLNVDVRELLDHTVKVKPKPARKKVRESPTSTIKRKPGRPKGKQAKQK